MEKSLTLEGKFGIILREEKKRPNRPFGAWAKRFLGVRS